MKKHRELVLVSSKPTWDAWLSEDGKDLIFEDGWEIVFEWKPTGKPVLTRAPKRARRKHDHSGSGDP
jgi:hypothetical protein